MPRSAVSTTAPAELPRLMQRHRATAAQQRQAECVRSREHSTYPRLITEARESPGRSRQMVGDHLRSRRSTTGDGIRAEELWRQPCLAYNLQVLLPTEVRRELVSIQRRFAEHAGLLRVPPRALHATVGWLLEVRTAYSTDKEALWRTHGEHWRSALERTVGDLSRFEIVYRSLLMTTTAIVAVAEVAEQVTVLRRTLAEQLDLPPETPSQPQLLHTTLYRYSTDRLSDLPRRTTVGEADVAISGTINELVLVRETVFPSISTCVVARFPLGPP